MRTNDALPLSGFPGVFHIQLRVLFQHQEAGHSLSTPQIFIASCPFHHIISHPIFSISFYSSDFIHLSQHIMCSSGAQFKKSHTNCLMQFFAPRWTAEITLCPYSQSLHHADCLCFSANDYTGTDTLAQIASPAVLADSFGRRVLLPLHCISRCHKNKKHINSKYDNTPFRAIPCFFPALRCAFFELAYANHSIQKRFTSLGNSAAHPFAGTGKNQTTATLQERATPGFHSPLSLRAARIHSIPLFSFTV